MKPNIVFVFADDWGRYASAYAKFEKENSINHVINTPNFDRIAEEGVIFKNAYVPAPSCTPCRSAVLSGQYFWQTGLGAILQGAVWDETIPTYPLELEKAGYHIGHTYKVWSPGRTRNAPYGAERTAYNSGGTKYHGFSFEVTKMLEDMSLEEAKGVLFKEAGDNFQSFLDARPEGKPFCYWWGPTNTHREWKKGSGKALWDLDPDNLKGRMPEFLPDVHEVREDVNDYLGECLAVDAGLGVIIQKLEEIGEIDNTLIVVSGDHGIPGFPRAKCNLYDIGAEVALAARWPGRIAPARIVEDQINIQDLAPTFMEAAGEPIPETMTAKSLMPIFLSKESGQIDPERTYVVTGRERHVHAAREGNLPYPQRAIRTKGFLYIINFEPERWPIGDPKGLDNPSTPPPEYDTLCNDTKICYADLDASPTKAWMIHNRNEDSVKKAYELGFGKRPMKELYDLEKDPDHMNNVANLAKYSEIKTELHEKLMGVLKEQKDPRICETPCRYENAPYTCLDN